MCKRQSGLTTIEFILGIIAAFGIYYGVKQLYVDYTLKPKDQSDIEAQIKSIRKEYNEGDNNSLIRARAQARFTQWSKTLPQRHPVVRRFVCEVKDVRSASFFRCEEGSIIYLIRLSKDDADLLSKKVKGDRLFFCGRLQSERSNTTWGGVLAPEIPVVAASVSDQKEKSCSPDFVPPQPKDNPPSR
jgi:hypothetical protein